MLAIGLHGGRAERLYQRGRIGETGGLTFDIVTGAAISTVNFATTI